ncbi:isochorismatase family protein [Flavobacterium sp.]|uniref:isochorismatase family protein n=1 Tax=Flavobacterium sp. TaxID=239 RepID=UPI0022C7D384|nr:isochorismatase family protein [Flavobacterium sp.]MCZ8228526.1 isochorismatase family protein [Flavobacterium sp.]
MSKRMYQIALVLAAAIFSANVYSQANLKKTNQFTPQNAAILLVDHQKMTMDWIYSQDKKNVENNLRMLSRIGAEVNVPLLVTTTMEEQVGLTWEGIQQTAPKQFANRIKRGGTLNCFIDPNFKAAVKNLNRKNLIICGLTTDICLLHTVTTAIELGYNVIVVADASGSMSKLADETSFDYFRQIGAKVLSANATVTELFQDFSTPDGQKVMQINLQEVVSKLGK